MILASDFNNISWPGAVVVIGIFALMGFTLWIAYRSTR